MLLSLKPARERPCFYAGYYNRMYCIQAHIIMDLPRWCQYKESTCQNAGDSRDSNSIPELGRSLEKGNGNPLQYSCLRNPVDRGASQATIHGVATHTICILSLFPHFVRIKQQVLPVFQKVKLHKGATTKRQGLWKTPCNLSQILNC